MTREKENKRLQFEHSLIEKDSKIFSSSSLAVYNGTNLICPISAAQLDG